ncbi:MAG TPA: D-cysteine desulfhydrase family protein [Chloroflexota bacterium]|nr:D-cysteine desulfhydrase family protein [Chloroflexota bacterium]
MIEQVDTRALTTAIGAKPRLPLAFLPTPLHEAPHLSSRLGIRVLLKRDDQTGLALGGNKVRKLEFLIAEALEQGADAIITTGGSQSNHARMTAAACRIANLACYLVLDRGVHPEIQGNLLLDDLFGAAVTLIKSPDPADAVAEMERVAERLRSEGRTPYIIPRGGSVPTGATGYAAMVPELLGQLGDLDVNPDFLYLATGSTGTHAGALAGLTAAGSSIPVRGISVSRDSASQEKKVLELANATLQYLGLPESVTASHIYVDDAYTGPGYGIPTTEMLDALDVLARDEGIILDPVYTGKAMAGMIDHAQTGKLPPNSTVVFLHTGGAPGLFAYNREIHEAVGARM